MHYPIYIFKDETIDPAIYGEIFKNKRPIANGITGFNKGAIYMVTVAAYTKFIKYQSRIQIVTREILLENKDIYHAYTIAPI